MTMCPPALVLLTLCAVAGAQEVLFFRDRNLASVPPRHGDVASAIRRLCLGPSPAELAAGYTSHVAPGTQLLDARQQGTVLQLVFDTTLVTAIAGCQLEHAIEQIDKTALRAPGVRSVRIAIRQPDGSEPDLGDLLGHPPALPPAPSPPPPFAFTSPFGALSGKRIAVSPGHGYYWHSTLGWTTQRGLIDGLIEDIHTAEICNQYLIPFLHNLGADVVFCREHGEVDQDPLVDNDAGAPGYSETGSWTTSASSGYNGGGYRFVGTGATETATATWNIPVAEDGLYPVFAWYRASGNRTAAANYRIHHTGGIGTATVDQQKDNLTWTHLGNFWFSAAAG
ncbi:MAG TPA: GerMN domain-containing protein, partial [Planctomycetota bacterium]|nr:GerMN domain-containing protein [Planctomycetota bacterium]